MHAHSNTSNVPHWSALLASAASQPGLILEAYSHFHNYSIGNQVLALVQCQMRGIQPGPIATFPASKERGRYVRKGERSLTLCMPVTCNHCTRLLLIAYLTVLFPVKFAVSPPLS